ncbi:hypothetical protein [Aliivibrio sp.]
MKYPQEILAVRVQSPIYQCSWLVQQMLTNDGLANCPYRVESLY